MKFNCLASFTSLFPTWGSDEFTSMYNYILIGRSCASVVVWHQFQWCHYFASSVTSTSSWTHSTAQQTLVWWLPVCRTCSTPPDLSYSTAFPSRVLNFLRCLLFLFTTCKSPVDTYKAYTEFIITGRILFSSVFVCICVCGRGRGYCASHIPMPHSVILCCIPTPPFHCSLLAVHKLGEQFVRILDQVNEIKMVEDVMCVASGSSESHKEWGVFSRQWSPNQKARPQDSAPYRSSHLLHYILHTPRDWYACFWLHMIHECIIGIMWS